MPGLAAVYHCEQPIASHPLDVSDCEWVRERHKRMSAVVSRPASLISS